MRLAIPVVFFALSAWFVLGPTQSGLPVPARVPVEPAAYSPEPVRPLPAEPTKITIGGVVQRCNDCHQFVETRPDRAELRQHTGIRLDHGLNARCLNCHAERDRSRLELHGGELVGFDEVERLCAKCHGPTFRDWERGIHGRTNGYWDELAGPRERLTCTECHDPHAPAFDPLVPLPGPNTWRMGDPSGHDEPAHGPPANPLDRWRLELEARGWPKRPDRDHHDGGEDG